MKLHGAASLCLVLLFLAPVAVKAQSGDPPAKTPSVSSPEVPEVPSGLMIVSEDDVQVLVGGLDSDFHRAEDEMAASRLTPAARSLRKAAAAIRLEASRAPHSDRRALAMASDSVEALARALKDGGKPDQATFHRIAGLAQAALAEHLLGLADRAWRANDSATTGEELEASLEHFAAAVDWTTGGLAESLAETYRQWVELAGVLHRGELGWTADQVRSTLDGYRAELLKMRP